MADAVPLSQAIAREEGFYKLNTRANRNNNPGNIEYGLFAKSRGATATDGRFAIFPTKEKGLDALRDLLSLHYAGKSIAECIRMYAPNTENNTAQYIRNVCAWTDLTPDTILEPAHI